MNKINELINKGYINQDTMKIINSLRKEDGWKPFTEDEFADYTVKNGTPYKNFKEFYENDCEIHNVMWAMKREDMLHEYSYGKNFREARETLKNEYLKRCDCICGVLVILYMDSLNEELFRITFDTLYKSGMPLESHIKAKDRLFLLTHSELVLNIMK